MRCTQSLSALLLGASIGVVAVTTCYAAQFELKRPQRPRLSFPPYVEDLATERADPARVEAARAAGDAALARSRTTSYSEYSIPLPEAPFPPPHPSNPEWPYWTGLCAELGAYMTTLARAYAVTDDRKYLDACLRATLSVCNDWPQWTDPDYGTQPCLDTHSLTRAVSVVYDLLHETLTERQRADIRRALTVKGAEFIFRHGQDPKSYVHHPRDWPNGYAVINTELGTAALTLLDEEPAAQGWLAQSLEKARLYFDEQGGKDGGLIEGFGYGSFAVDTLMFLVQAADRNVGVSLFDHPYLESAIFFPAYSILPDAPLLASIGDNGDANGCGVTLLDTARADVAVRGNPVAAWYLARAGAASAQERKLAHIPEGLPLGRRFESVRWVALRTGWQSDDAVMVFKCGFPWAHNHLDQNHFVLGYGSQWVINDPGYQIYDMEYPPEAKLDRDAIRNMHRYTYGTEGHNSLLVDGAGQLANAGEVPRFFSSHAVGYTMGDATACYSDRLSAFRRHVIQLPGRFYLLWDEVEASQPRRVESLLHTLPDGQFLAEGVELPVDEAVRLPALVIRRSAAQVAVDFLSPPALTTTARVWPDSANYGHYIATGPAEAVRTLDMVTMLRPGPVGEASRPLAEVVVGPLSGKRAVIELDGETDTILLGPGEAGDGVEADGQLAVIGATAEGLKRWALVNGTRLTQKGAALIEASGLLSAAVLRVEDSLRLQVECSEPRALTIGAVPGFGGMRTIVGGSVGASYDGAAQVLTLTLAAGRYDMLVSL